MNKSQHLRDLENSFDLLQLGMYLGFPKCCVLEFKEYLMACRSKNRPTPRPERKLSGTGYVPCAECNHKTEAQLVETITENRMCPEPFPNYGVHQIKPRKRISK
jgi:hypothetical protein